MKTTNPFKPKKNVLRFEKKPKHCPICNSISIAYYIYGMPSMNEKMQQRLKQGKIVLGGCVLMFDDPKWMCNNCKTDFFKILSDEELNRKPIAIVNY